MGGRLTSLNGGSVKEYEDEVSYEKLYDIRRRLFPDTDNDELLRQSLRDKVPTLVFSDDNGFRIYVGSAIHAHNVQALREEGINYIVNMAAGDLHTSKDFYGQDYSCLMINATDLEHYDLSQHFTEVSEFLEEARERRGRVLVHCMAGVSRSVTVTVAYLMMCHSMSLSQAAKEVHSKRLQAYPNIRFIENLVQLEREIRQKNNHAQMPTQ